MKLQKGNRAMEINERPTEKKKENKVNKLFTKLGIFSAILLILLIILIITFKMFNSKKDIFQNQLSALNNNNNSIVLQIKNLESKSVTAKNYIQIWDNEFTSNQKKLAGINVEELRVNIKNIADNNILDSLNITISPVILAGKTFDNDSIRTYTAILEIKFNAISDVDVYKFIDDLNQNLGYFITIQSIEMKKLRAINEEFLKALRSGTMIASTEVKLELRIYGLGENKKSYE